MRFDAAEFLMGLFRPAAGGGQSAAREAEPPAAPPQLPTEWHFAWDERAAILEYDAGFPRERAEAMAITEILGQMR